MVKEGKVRRIGLSGRADTLRRAASVHRSRIADECPVWERDVERKPADLPRTEHRLVPYSPLGRGFLAGGIRSLADLAADDRDATIRVIQTRTCRGTSRSSMR
jgi:aryl-alcohol dehydrogenase-like predicted oxidoreductase